jgi:hypothetical protein
MSDSVSSFFSGVGQTISQGVQDLGTGLASVDKSVGEFVPGGWGTLAGLAAAPFTGGASLSEMIAADAADLAAQGIGQEQIAQIMAQNYGIDEFAAANVAGMAAAGTGASDIASTLAADYGTQLTGLGGQAASAASTASNVGNLVKYAKTGSDIIGGLGKLAGGAYAMNAGRQINPAAADPFSPYRSQYAAQLQGLMANPQTVTSTPGYQFNLSQGLQGLQAQQAAQGRLVSGGALIQGQQYGQNLAQQTYQQQLQNLAGLSGATQAPGTGATAQANLLGGQLGATLGGAQAIAGGLGGVLNPLATLYANYNNPSPSVAP